MAPNSPVHPNVSSVFSCSTKISVLPRSAEIDGCTFPEVSCCIHSCRQWVSAPGFLTSGPPPQAKLAGAQPKGLEVKLCWVCVNRAHVLGLRQLLDTRGEEPKRIEGTGATVHITHQRRLSFSFLKDDFSVGPTHLGSVASSLELLPHGTPLRPISVSKVSTCISCIAHALRSKRIACYGGQAKCDKGGGGQIASHFCVQHMFVRCFVVCCVVFNTQVTCDVAPVQSSFCCSCR